MKRKEEITLPVADVQVIAREDREGWLEDYAAEDRARRETESDRQSFPPEPYRYSEALAREADRSREITRIEYGNGGWGEEAKLFRWETWTNFTLRLTYEYENKRYQAVTVWPRRGEWKAEAPLFVTVRKDDPGKIVWVEEDDGERDVTRRRTLGLLLIAAAAVGGLLLAFGLRACGIEFPL